MRSWLKYFLSGFPAICIKGNEKVDLLAKAAKNNNEIYEDIKLEVSEYNEIIETYSFRVAK